MPNASAMAAQRKKDEEARLAKEAGAKRSAEKAKKERLASRGGKQAPRRRSLREPTHGTRTGRGHATPKAPRGPRASRSRRRCRCRGERLESEAAKRARLEES